jgi:hypothetical protein
LKRFLALDFVFIFGISVSYLPEPTFGRISACRFRPDAPHRAECAAYSGFAALSSTRRRRTKTAPARAAPGRQAACDGRGSQAAAQRGEGADTAHQEPHARGQRHRRHLAIANVDRGGGQLGAVVVEGGQFDRVETFGLRI